MGSAWISQAKFLAGGGSAFPSAPHKSARVSPQQNCPADRRAEREIPTSESTLAQIYRRCIVPLVLCSLSYTRQVSFCRATTLVSIAQRYVLLIETLLKRSGCVYLQVAGTCFNAHNLHIKKWLNVISATRRALMIVRPNLYVASFANITM